MSDNPFESAAQRAADFLNSITEVTFIEPKPQDVPPQDIPADQPYVPTPAELKSFRERTSLPFAECRRLLALARGDQNKAIMISRDERMEEHRRRGGGDIFFGWPMTYFCPKCGKGSWQQGGRSVCCFCGAKAPLPFQNRRGGHDVQDKGGGRGRSEEVEGDDTKGVEE